MILPIAIISAELRSIPIKLHKFEYDGRGTKVENPTWVAVGGPRVRFVPDAIGF